VSPDQGVVEDVRSSLEYHHGRHNGWQWSPRHRLTSPLGLLHHSLEVYQEWHESAVVCCWRSGGVRTGSPAS